jgi:outer membrane lipoprotein-sorting protein
LLKSLKSKKLIGSMKKKNNTLIVILIIVLLGVGVWLWLGNKGSPSDQGVISSGEELSLSDIFKKTGSISSFKYDMVSTAPGQASQTIKMWRKGSKIRMEGTFEGQSMVYLVDGDKQSAYMYLPSQNTAMKTDFSKAQEISGESPTEQSASATNYNPITVGDEVLDGKSCVVVQYETETASIKMWVWKEYGLPIKTESTTSQGTSVIELKNIEIGDISNSMFELPSGVQVLEIPTF